jgi:hypothetical protein
MTVSYTSLGLVSREHLDVVRTQKSESLTGVYEAVTMSRSCDVSIYAVTYIT